MGIKMEKIEQLRGFLQATGWEQWEQLERDQAKDIPMPPRQKTYPADSQLFDLVAAADLKVGQQSLKEIIGQRRSRRKYQQLPLNREELSYLLWATQGADQENDRLRTVPSAGARHPFETYLLINRVEGFQPGLYRYLPLEHKLLLIRHDQGLMSQVNQACRNQRFVGESAVVFVWTVIPYRTEWRYSILSHKVIAIDVGHLCQNLYLASESIGAGTCGIGAYNQEKIDQLLGVDGEEEFTIYLASVGKIDN